MGFLKIVLLTLGDMAVMLGVIGAIGLVYAVAYAALHREIGEEE